MFTTGNFARIMSAPEQCVLRYALHIEDFKVVRELTVWTSLSLGQIGSAIEKRLHMSADTIRITEVQANNGREFGLKTPVSAVAEALQPVRVTVGFSKPVSVRVLVDLWKVCEMSVRLNQTLYEIGLGVQRKEKLSGSFVAIGWRDALPLTRPLLSLLLDDKFRLNNTLKIWGPGPDMKYPPQMITKKVTLIGRQIQTEVETSLESHRMLPVRKVLERIVVRKPACKWVEKGTLCVDGVPWRFDSIRIGPKKALSVLSPNISLVTVFLSEEEAPKKVHEVSTNPVSSLKKYRPDVPPESLDVLCYASREPLDDNEKIHDVIERLGVREFLLHARIARIRILVTVWICDDDGEKVTHEKEYTFFETTAVGDLYNQIEYKAPNQVTMNLYLKREYADQKLEDHTRSLGDLKIVDGMNVVIKLRIVPVSLSTAVSQLPRVDLERYVLVKEYYGRGASAYVSLYQDPTTMARYAVKWLNGLDDAAVSELVLSASLPEHPCIVKTYGVARKGMESIGVVMDFVPSSLEAKIKDMNSGVMFWSTDKYLALVGIALGLRFLHRKTPGKPAIVHRDVKPANVLIDEDGHVRLCDFGIAANLAESLLHTGVGTPCYMAPEVIRGQDYDEKVDVFAFACILYELITGHTLIQMRNPTIYGYQNRIAGGYRPDVPLEIEGTALGALLVRSWDGNPMVRPSFDEIVETLTDPRNALADVDFDVVAEYVNSVQWWERDNGFI